MLVLLLHSHLMSSTSVDHSVAQHLLRWHLDKRSRGLSSCSSSTTSGCGHSLGCSRHKRMAHDSMNVYVGRHITNKDVTGQGVRQHVVHVPTRGMGRDKGSLLGMLLRMLLTTVVVVVIGLLVGH